MIVATSRFGNPNVPQSPFARVGIVRYPPKFLRYELTANLYDFAPTGAQLELAKGPNGRALFTASYLQRLDDLGPERARMLLDGVGYGYDGVVLLCYEDCTDGVSWCHRLLLGAWLRDNLHIDVQEIADLGKQPKGRAALRVAQASLFA